jgi:hypothetical protein
MVRSSALIGTLTVSGLLLAALSILLPGGQRSASAEVSTLGDYTLISAANATGGDDYVTVVDNREGKMLTYQVNNIQGMGRLELVGALDLTLKAGGR